MQTTPAATGLVQPGSRLQYRYRVRTAEDPLAWRAAFAAAFPDAGWEVHTFAERSERLGEVLGRIASGLLLIGLSALFVGGLGVFNSVRAFLHGKLATIATLRALGLRNRRLAAAAPTVISIRTESIMREARDLLGKAAAGLTVIAGVSLLASLLVLVSAIASSRARQIYDASILHTLGAWVSAIRRSLRFEFALLAVLTSAFAVAVGSAIAMALLQYRLQLETENIWWMGVVTAIAVSTLNLGLSARPLLRRLRMTASVLREGG